MKGWLSLLRHLYNTFGHSTPDPKHATLEQGLTFSPFLHFGGRARLLGGYPLTQGLLFGGLGCAGDLGTRAWVC